jgi:chemotaxis-related protein WspD
MDNQPDINKPPQQVILAQTVEAIAPASATQTPAAELRACWSEIGVHGDRTCPELQKFVHCRNCPVYSNAGIRLLDRPLPSGYRHELSERFAGEKMHAPQQNAATVLFRIDAEWFALPTQVFQEVCEQRRIHSLPRYRQGIVLGLANIRGELLICVSLGHLLGLDKLPSLDDLRASYHRLLVANWAGHRLAFPVDEIPCTHRFNFKELKPPPATVALSGSSYARGVFHWQGHAVGLLNPELLFPALNRSLS